MYKILNNNDHLIFRPYAVCLGTPSRPSSRRRTSTRISRRRRRGQTSPRCPRRLQRLSRQISSRSVSLWGSAQSCQIHVLWFLHMYEYRTCIRVSAGCFLFCWRFCRVFRSYKFVVGIWIWLLTAYDILSCLNLGYCLCFVFFCVSWFCRESVSSVFSWAVLILSP